MKKKTATELRLKAKIRQKTVRNRKKALGLKQLNVWIDNDAFNILSKLQENLKHKAKAETVEWAIYLLRRRVESHIRDTSGMPPGFNLLD
jgi:hypothetical protein